MDKIKPEQRSAVMRSIRSKNTKPELAVRRLVTSLGFRYRLNAKNLPGSPDLVFTTARKVIFVHGCFWHLHNKCHRVRLPETRIDCWLPKLEGNKLRDRKNIRLMKKLGWDVLVIWECELDDVPKLETRLREFFASK